MRILFISSSPLTKEVSVGNTFLNLFSEMEDLEFASIFTRNGMPDEAISQSFCITEKMIIKNLLGKGKTGIVVKKTVPENKNPISDSSDSKVSFIKRHRWTIFFWLQKLVWRVGRWKSNELKAFVEEFNPDIIFTLLSDLSFLNNLILHVNSITKAKLVLYAWDNNYSLKRLMFSPLKWINHFTNRYAMRKTAKAADLLYVISDVQKKDYEKAFKHKCKVLTKGKEFNENANSIVKTNKPLKLLFTGNVGLNRWKTLAKIVKALERINVGEIKAQLFIYSGNEITAKMKKALHRENSSFFMGKVSAEQVIELQKQSDILVHVEAFDLKNRLSVRQSFSTKIVDYLHQAKCVLAVGPKDVASMDYLIKNDAAATATNDKEIEEKLRMLIENPEKLNEYGNKAWETGKKNHQITKIREMLIQDFKEIMYESCTD